MLPSESNLFAFLSNRINSRQNIYYLSGINCFKDQDTSLASNHLELRTIVLKDEILYELRRITRRRSINDLSRFPPSDRHKILDIIYRQNRNLSLAKDWIKLLLLGTSNFYVFLADKGTGRTCETLIIDKNDLEEYLVSNDFDYFFN